MSFTLAKRSCPVCGGEDNFRKLFEQRFEQLGSNYVVSECKNCGLIQQNPAWNQEFYDGLYEDFTYDPSNHKYFPAQVERYKLVAETVGDLVSGRTDARVLDYGCYDGSFLEWIKRSAGWAKDVELVGYDIVLKDIAPGSDIYSSLGELTRTAKKFDVVVLNHTLEHILHPRKVLSFIKESLLKEGGYIVIEVPDISFIRRDDISPFHIQHVNYFAPQTMARLCNSLGLAIERLKTFKNFDIGRDPSSPTLLVVAQKDAEFLPNGAVLEKAVALHREKLQNKLRRLGNNIALGVVGCGDPLIVVHELLPEGIKLVALFDNNKKLWGKKIYGCEIKPVEAVKDAGCDAVLISTLNVHNTEQLLKQLSQYMPLDKIVTLLDFNA